MPEGKRTGPDKIQSFWLTSFTAAHEILTAVLNESIKVGDDPRLKEELF